MPAGSPGPRGACTLSQGLKIPCNMLAAAAALSLGFAAPLNVTTVVEPPTAATAACGESTQAACDADAACTWCKCGALPSQCWTLDDAKKLPAGVYTCDKKLATEVQAAEAQSGGCDTYRKELHAERTRSLPAQPSAFVTARR